MCERYVKGVTRFFKHWKCVSSVSSGCQFCVRFAKCVSSVCQVDVKCGPREWMEGRPLSSEVCEVCQVCFKCVTSVSNVSRVCQVHVKCVQCVSSVLS